MSDLLMQPTTPAPFPMWIVAIIFGVALILFVAFNFGFVVLIKILKY